jgi:hypothetical protein
MLSKKNIASIVSTAIKIFFIGLLLQFIAHTFVTYALGQDNTFWTIIRAWKELWIIGAIAIIGSALYHQFDKIKTFREHFPLKKYSIIFVLTAAFILFVGTALTNSGLTTTIMSLRYSMTWFALFIIGFILAVFFIKENSISREKRYIKVIKYLLIGWLVWRWLVYFLPAFIELFGYNKRVFEWQVGQQPPAVYYSNITQWMVRNQFLFERPIHRWMFLVMFWPLFFLLAIKNKERQTQMIWWSIYGLNILSTLSRAAWIAWIIQTAIILLIMNTQNMKKLILYGFLPGLVLLAGFTYRAKDDIINRSFSNLGHIKHTLTAIQKVSQKPVIGRWPGIAWPASHHRKDIQNYNPENQYLQIRLEYGIIGFAGRMYLYLWLQILGYRSYRKLQHDKLTKEQRYRSWVIITLAIGLFGLSIEWFFLHSFVDRMIVYPSMLLFGICFAIYYKHFHHEYKTQREQ